MPKRLWAHAEAATAWHCVLCKKEELMEPVDEIGNLEHKLRACTEEYMGQTAEESWFCWQPKNWFSKNLGTNLRDYQSPLRKNSTLITFIYYNINFKLLYFLLLNLLSKDCVYPHCFGIIFILLRASSPPTSSLRTPLVAEPLGRPWHHK